MSDDDGDWAEGYRDDHRRRPPTSRRTLELRRHGHAQAWAAVVVLVGWLLVVRDAVAVDASSTVAFVLLLAGLALAGRAVVFYLPVRGTGPGRSGPPHP